MRIKLRKRLEKDLLPDVPARPQRKRRRENGRLVPIKNAASAANAKPKRVYLTTGSGARSKALMGAPLDRRSALGRLHEQYQNEYRAHVGTDLTIPQADLCDMAGRLKLVSNIAFSDLMQHGVFDSSGTPRRAFDTFRKADSDRRAILSMLGIERKVKEVPDLHDYLRRKGAGNDQD